MISPPRPATRHRAEGQATLKRAGKIYATGTLKPTHGRLRLALELNRRRTLPSGSYTLILSWKAGKTRHTSRQHITLR